MKYSPLHPLNAIQSSSLIYISSRITFVPHPAHSHPYHLLLFIPHFIFFPHFHFSPSQFTATLIHSTIISFLLNIFIQTTDTIINSAISRHHFLPIITKLHIASIFAFALPTLFRKLISFKLLFQVNGLLAHYPRSLLYSFNYNLL